MEYRLHLQTVSPGMLVFREAYNPGWDAAGRKLLETDYYANGYLFDAGIYDFTLRHLPDTAHRIGLSIRVIGLLALACALTGLTLARRDQASEVKRTACDNS